MFFILFAYILRFLITMLKTKVAYSILKLPMIVYNIRNNAIYLSFFYSFIFKWEFTQADSIL